MRKRSLRGMLVPCDVQGLLLPTTTTGDEWMRIAQVAPLTEAGRLLFLIFPSHSLSFLVVSRPPPPIPPPAAGQAGPPQHTTREQRSVKEGSVLPPTPADIEPS